MFFIDNSNCYFNMWPLLVDMTKDESIQCLRNLELEAYSHLVSALRAQGSLSSDKKKLLKETSNVLNISEDRHTAEVRRALSDEKLNTIAYHMCGQNEYIDDWAQEGRRPLALMSRVAPQMSYSSIADDLSDTVEQIDKQIPYTVHAEKKRSTVTPINHNLSIETNKLNMYKVVDPSKQEEGRKRKFSETSTLAQYLLGPSSKMSKIQQIYRQKTKSKSREQFIKNKNEVEQQESAVNKITQKTTQNIKSSAPVTTISSNGSNINQHLDTQLQQSFSIISENQIDLNNCIVQKFNEQNHITQLSNINENSSNRVKLISKTNSCNTIYKPITSAVPTSISVDVQKTSKIFTTKKANTNTVSTSGQKIIVVSNPQSLTTNSILQRSLTLPFKNISVKTLDKFKIVTTTITPITITNPIVTGNNLNSVKHKVVTVRTNTPIGSGKKVFPLTQLQMLNKGNIKVLPIGGKIVCKTSSAVTTPSVHFVNTIENIPSPLNSINNLPVITANTISQKDEVEDSQVISEIHDSNNGKLEEIKYSQIVIDKNNIVPVNEDYDSKIDEFHIQTLPVSSQDVNTTEIDVQCQNDYKAEENTEFCQSEIICIPKIDCLTSGDQSKRIPDETETKIEDSSNTLNQTEDLKECEFKTLQHNQELISIDCLKN